MKRKILAICISALMAVSLAVSSFAMTESDISQITGALGDFSVSNVLMVLVAALGIAIPLILIWFAFRKIFAWAKSAFYGG